MSNWERHAHEEHGVRVGTGTAFCYYDATAGETKYHILSVVTSMPEVSGEKETIDYSTTTNPTTTNIEGKKSLNNPEISVPYNLDNIYKLNALKGKELNFAYVDLDDFSGQEFTGVLDYRVAEISTTGVKEIIISIATSSIADGVSTNLFDIYQDTIRFKKGIPTSLVLTKGATATTIKVSTIEEATLTATSDTTGVCTVTLTSGTLSITPVAAGSADIKIEAVDSGNKLASNTRYIKVIVVE